MFLANSDVSYSPLGSVMFPSAMTEQSACFRTRLDLHVETTLQQPSSTALMAHTVIDMPSTYSSGRWTSVPLLVARIPSIVIRSRTGTDKYSVILPTYNERKNLPIIVWLLAKTFTTQQASFTLLCHTADFVVGTTGKLSWWTTRVQMGRKTSQSSWRGYTAKTR